MNNVKLFMAILGCRPKGRFTEQHDVFFGIGKNLKDLIPQMKTFWPDAGGLHVDSWREVSTVDGYKITIVNKETDSNREINRLFFINLGGYKENDLEEYHYKILSVGSDKASAITLAKKTAFYKHTSSSEKGGRSHIDDKYGIDVDDVFNINDVLPEDLKKQYSIQIKKTTGSEPDKLNIGYLPLNKIK